MEKHRINTTISAKHWEILKKHAAKNESQQKTLELALESLEDKSKQNSILSSHEQLLTSLLILQIVKVSLRYMPG